MDSMKTWNKILHSIEEVMFMLRRRALKINNVRVRNWSITINYSSYIRLWLVNFLLFQPHPLLLLLIVDHAWHASIYSISPGVHRL